MKAIKSLRFLTLLPATAVLAAMLASAPGVALADGTTVAYTGQGFIDDGTGTGTLILKSDRCGTGTANDGGTGQFANWNGLGQPYQAGQPYLVWVLTANGATAAHIYDTDGNTFPVHPGFNMFPVGGTFKYASPYFSPDDTIGSVFADYLGRARGSVQLTVSHGCAPFELEACWCSPGYWKNADDAAWVKTGLNRNTDTYGGHVGAIQAVNSACPAAPTPDPSLQLALETENKNNPFPSVGGVRALAANCVGEYLTSLLGGCAVDLSHPDNACPIDNQGDCKEGFSCPD